jgi:hypothetical protein
LSPDSTLSRLLGVEFAALEGHTSLNIGNTSL